VAFKYRLHWCAEPPPPRLPRATVAQTRIGAGPDEATRLFVIDIAGDHLTLIPDKATLSARVNADKGKITHIVVQPIPRGGWRISFELSPGREKLIELNAQLFGADAPLSEIWLYRWTA
jgi:glucans biosynthesis protein